MKRIMSSLTTEQAMAKFIDRTNATLVNLVKEALSNRRVKSSRAMGGNLRASADPTEKGYSGVDKAKNMLNEMIQETQAKYDIEIQQCCDYDTTAASTRPRTCSMR